MGDIDRRKLLFGGTGVEWTNTDGGNEDDYSDVEATRWGEFGNAHDIFIFEGEAHASWHRPAAGMAGNGFGFGQFSHTFAWVYAVTQLTPKTVYAVLSKSAATGADQKGDQHWGRLLHARGRRLPTMARVALAVSIFPMELASMSRPELLVLVTNLGAGVTVTRQCRPPINAPDSPNCRTAVRCTLRDISATLLSAGSSFRSSVT